MSENIEGIINYFATIKETAENLTQLKQDADSTITELDSLVSEVSDSFSGLQEKSEKIGHALATSVTELDKLTNNNSSIKRSIVSIEGNLDRVASNTSQVSNDLSTVLANMRTGINDLNITSAGLVQTISGVNVKLDAALQKMNSFNQALETVMAFTELKEVIDILMEELKDAKAEVELPELIKRHGLSFAGSLIGSLLVRR